MWPLSYTRKRKTYHTKKIIDNRKKILKEQKSIGSSGFGSINFIPPMKKKNSTQKTSFRKPWLSQTQSLFSTKFFPSPLQTIDPSLFPPYPDQTFLPSFQLCRNLIHASRFPSNFATAADFALSLSILEPCADAIYCNKSLFLPNLTSFAPFLLSRLSPATSFRNVHENARRRLPKKETRFWPDHFLLLLQALKGCSSKWAESAVRAGRGERGPTPWGEVTGAPALLKKLVSYFEKCRSLASFV